MSSNEKNITEVTDGIMSAFRKEHRSLAIKWKIEMALSFSYAQRLRRDGARSQAGHWRV
jgi:hypothetical protein